MPGRKYSSNNFYRYGFNGKEQDGINGKDELDFGSRIYNAKIGRFLSPDKLHSIIPFNSPYSFAGNKPIVSIDQNGDLEVVVHIKRTIIDPVLGTRTSIEIKRYTYFTVEDMKGINRDPVEVKIYITATATPEKAGTNGVKYVWSSTLNKVEDVDNTGLTRKEKEKAESMVGYIFNESFKSISRGIGVFQLTEAGVGEDLETGRKKSTLERWVDLADGVVTGLSMGRMGTTARLKKWALETARDQMMEKSIEGLMDQLGIKDETQRAIFGYHMFDAAREGATGKLNRIKDAIVKSLEMGTMGAQQIIKEMNLMGYDMNAPKDKNEAIRKAITTELAGYITNCVQTILCNYNNQKE